MLKTSQIIAQEWNSAYDTLKQDIEFGLITKVSHLKRVGNRWSKKIISAISELASKSERGELSHEDYANEEETLSDFFNQTICFQLEFLAKRIEELNK